MTLLPQAKAEKIKMSDRTYEGANPVFYDINEGKGVPNIQKAFKGVPFRKVNQNGKSVK